MGLLRNGPQAQKIRRALSRRVSDIRQLRLAPPRLYRVVPLVCSDIQLDST
jgi:hypothetical protein